VANLSERQIEMCETSPVGLIDISTAIMEKNGAAVEALRPVDYDTS
jgi:hypothetical protein